MKRQSVLLQPFSCDDYRFGVHFFGLALGFVLFSSFSSLVLSPCFAQTTLPKVQADQPSNSPPFQSAPAGSTPDTAEPTQSSKPASSKSAQPQATSTVPPKAQTSKPFLDVGIGPRIGLGEPTYPAGSIRLGVPLSTNTSLSLRPFYVFGNSDSNGVANSQGEFTLPLTLDLFTDSPVSAYFGPGLSWNIDSSSKTVFSLSGGLDFKIIEKVRLSTGLYYGMDYDKSGFGELGANAFLYFRF